MSHDATRPQLGGLLFGTDEVVATDGHRMHVADFGGFGIPTLLPASGVDTLLRCLPRSGFVTASSHDDYVRVTGEGWVWAVRPLAEQFPRYQNVVPKKSEQAAMFEVGRSAMKGLFSKLPRRTSSARINVNGSLEVVASTGNDNLPTAVANAPLLKHLGPDINVCVDPRYIKDAIRTGDDVVVGRFGDGMSSMTLEPAPGLLAVVMLQRD